MPKRAPLVTQHLERISREALEEYQDIVKKFVRGRQGVYALYRGEKLYYVGLASNLRNRLRHHLKDRQGIHLHPGPARWRSAREPATDGRSGISNGPPGTGSGWIHSAGREMAQRLLFPMKRRLFEVTASGRIAVKVINRYRDDVLKVYPV